MRIVISGYGNQNDNLILYDIDYNKLIRSHKLSAPSFVVKSNVGYLTYNQSDNLELLSYDNDLNLIDKYQLENKTMTHLVYSNKNNILFGCSYHDASYFGIKVINGYFKELCC